MRRCLRGNLAADTFYSHVKRALTSDDILMPQTSVPLLQGDERHNTMRAFKVMFEDATYPGGAMAVGWGTDGVAPEIPQDVLQGRFDAAGITPDY